MVRSVRKHGLWRLDRLVWIVLAVALALSAPPAASVGDETSFLQERIAWDLHDNPGDAFDQVHQCHHGGCIAPALLPERAAVQAPENHSSLVEFTIYRLSGLARAPDIKPPIL